MAEGKPMTLAEYTAKSRQALRAENDKLKEQIKDLEQENVKLIASNAELTHMNETMNEEFEKRFQEKEESKKKYKELHDRFDALLCENEAILTENDSLHKKVNQLQDQIQYLLDQQVPEGLTDGILYILQMNDNPDMCILSADSFKQNTERMLTKYDAYILKKFKCTSPMNIKQQIKKDYPGMFTKYYYFEKNLFNKMVELIVKNNGKEI